MRLLLFIFLFLINFKVLANSSDLSPFSFSKKEFLNIPETSKKQVIDLLSSKKEGWFFFYHNKKENKKTKILQLQVKIIALKKETYLESIVVFPAMPKDPKIVPSSDRISVYCKFRWTDRLISIQKIHLSMQDGGIPAYKFGLKKIKREDLTSDLKQQNFTKNYTCPLNIFNESNINGTHIAFAQKENDKKQKKMYLFYLAPPLAVVLD